MAIKIPTYNAQASQNISRFGGLSGQSGGAGAGSFGGNQARNLANAGGAIAQLSAKTMDIQNQARLVDARNQYETLSRQIETEYSKLQSGDALGKQQEYIDQLEQQRRDLSEQLDNPYQREMFGNIADRNDMNTKFNMQRHEYVESVRYKEDNKKASLLNINEKAQRSLAGGNYKEVVDGAVFEAQAYLYKDGDSEKVRKAKELIYLNNLHSQNIKILATKDARLAEAYMKELGDEIPVGVRAEYEKQVKQESIEDEAMALAQLYNGKDFEDMTEQDFNKILKEYPGGTDRDFVRIARSEFRYQKQLQKNANVAEYKEKYMSRIDAIDSGKIVNEKQLELVGSGLDGNDRASLKRYLRDKTGGTNVVFDKVSYDTDMDDIALMESNDKERYLQFVNNTGEYADIDKGASGMFRRYPSKAVELRKRFLDDEIQIKKGTTDSYQQGLDKLSTIYYNEGFQQGAYSSAKVEYRKRYNGLKPEEQVDSSKTTLIAEQVVVERNNNIGWFWDYTTFQASGREDIVLGEPDTRPGGDLAKAFGANWINEIELRDGVVTGGFYYDPDTPNVVYSPMTGTKVSIPEAYKDIVNKEEKKGLSEEERVGTFAPKKKPAPKQLISRETAETILSSIIG